MRVRGQMTGLELSIQPTVYARQLASGQSYYAKIKYPVGHQHWPAGGWRTHPTSQGYEGKALMVAEEMQARVDQGAAALELATAVPAAVVTIRDLSERYLAEYRNPRKVKDITEWRKAATDDLRRLVWPTLGERPAAQLRSSDVRRLLVYLREEARGGKGYAPKTCNMAVDRLKGLYTWAIDLAEVLSMKHPCRGVELYPTQAADDFWTMDEAQRFVAADVTALLPVHGVQQRWHLAMAEAWAMALVVLYQGLRWGELRGLYWADIDLDVLTLHVQRQVGGRAPKGWKPRLLPLHAEVVPHLRWWRALCPRAPAGIEPHVFPRLSGEPLTGGNDKTDCNRMRKLCELIGLRCLPKPWQDVRHTFATHLDDATGANEVVVGAMLGNGGSRQIRDRASGRGAAVGAAVTRGYIHREVRTLARELALLSYLPSGEGISRITDSRGAA